MVCKRCVGQLHILLSEADDDEFAAYDFSEFTEEDFARIDVDIAKKEHLAKVTIAYETTSGQSRLGQSFSNEQSRTRPSPLEAFRQYGTLSVTDLASPSWCEVQFEYGLLGKRAYPLRERPRSFTSAFGKEIRIDSIVGVQNDVVTRKGKAIHKVLEREVKPQEVVVQVTSIEERWALRLSNMLVCLKGMGLEGFTREMPVFGIEDGEVIVGIIDELLYRPLPEDTSITERLKPISSQKQIENYFTPGCTVNSENAIFSEPLFKLQIIDTKTRKRPSLPLDEDMLPSRLQLMLYHRLLSKLVAFKPSFDFTVFWQLANVNPEQQLSQRFLEQVGLIADEGEFQICNLNDLSALWYDLVHQLRIASVDDQLELIYRLQIHGKCKKGYSEPLIIRIMPEVTEADSCSSRDSLVSTAAIVPSEIVPSLSISESDNEISTSTMTRQDTTKEKYQILGTKVFTYDSEFLSSHLADVLAWWRGERKPKGVPVELARRCTTCEYCTDCEWREERAKEFREQAALEKIT